MRWLAILVLAPVAVVLAGFAFSPGDTSARTSLKISYWPDGSNTPTAKTWTLRCDPVGGTLPSRRAACRRLAAAGTKLFAPVPRDTFCTQVYGGPHVARIVGTVKGKRVSASFSRANGCQIARWNRLSPWLLPSPNS
jgi:hypothetical protein